MGMSDPTGVLFVFPVSISRDGKIYAFTYGRFLNDLFLANGLR